MKDFTFVDLFCGIGGFHQAMAGLGGRCVFACDIDRHCRETYYNNYGIRPAEDITRIDEHDVPGHDVLCGGFPCQAFSKAGKRLGFDDPTKGTLFFDVMRIVRAKRPQYVLLENVRNLASHDGGNTWRTIRESLAGAGYDVTEQPIIFSPHWLGIPQHRERVFIMAVCTDTGTLPRFCFNTKRIPACSIKNVLEPIDSVSEKYLLSFDELALFQQWNLFLHYTRTSDGRLPGFPIWTEYFRDDATVDESMPKWKQAIVRKNIDYYRTNRKFIDTWLPKARETRLFFGAKAKLEWQAGVDVSEPRILDYIIQYRPSGIRVKPATYFPALVAMDQHSIIGPEVRYMTPRECARIQSFPDDFIIDESDSQAYKQFGNSVNVDVVRLFARFLLGDADIRREYSYENQYGTQQIIQDTLL